MNSCIYTLHSIAWAMFGVIVGVLLDRAVLDLRRIARRATKPEGAEPVEPTRQTARRRFGAAVVPAVLIVLAIVTTVKSVADNRTNAAQDAETLRVQQCQLAYANGFADALDARSKANAEAQQALDDLMTKIGQLTAAPSADNGVRFQAALADYLSKRAQAKEQQTQNPYPPAPRDLCR